MTARRRGLVPRIWGMKEQSAGVGRNDGTDLRLARWGVECGVGSREGSLRLRLSVRSATRRRRRDSVLQVIAEEAERALLLGSLPFGERGVFNAKRDRPLRRVDG